MYKLIIVDDEQEILDVLENFLKKTGNFDIKTFNDSKAAVKYIIENNCDLVLLDIMMPNLNGLECLERIYMFDSDVKVIMMTAFDTLDKQIEAHKYNAVNYITKPFESLKYVHEKIIKELE